MNTRTWSENVKDVAADYGWDRVAEALLPELAHALGKIGKHVVCPFHGGKGDFRLPKDFPVRGVSVCNCGFRHVINMISELKGVSNSDALRMIDELVNQGRAQQSEPSVTQEERLEELWRAENTPEKVTHRRTQLGDLWKTAFPMDHPASAIGREYIRNRGLKLPRGFDTPMVRFHPRLPYYEEVEVAKGQKPRVRLVGYFPGLVSRVLSRSLKSTQALHRTYLTPDGFKLDVADAKKLTSMVVTERTIGMSIPLYKGKSMKRVHVAEGLETAWAIAMNTGETTWSTVNATLLEKQLFPKETEEVWIWADKDRSQTGQRAAQVLCNQALAMGKKVMVMLPAWDIPDGQKSLDWLDVHNTFDFSHVPLSVRRDKLISVAESEGLQITRHF